MARLSHGLDDLRWSVSTIRMAQALHAGRGSYATMKQLVDEMAASIPQTPEPPSNKDVRVKPIPANADLDQIRQDIESGTNIDVRMRDMVGFCSADVVAVRKANRDARSGLQGTPKICDSVYVSPKKGKKNGQGERAPKWYSGQVVGLVQEDAKTRYNVRVAYMRQTLLGVSEDELEIAPYEAWEDILREAERAQQQGEASDVRPGWTIRDV